MKLNFLKEVPLETLRKNIDMNLNNYMLETNEWIFSFFEDGTPFLQLEKEVNDFEMITSEERPEKTDIENIRKIYSELKNLSIVEATSENLWVGLAHSNFWKYIKYRASFDKSFPTQETINRSFFFSNGKRRSLIFHPLSRLWWTGHLVYEEGRTDPFELLNVFRTDFQTKLLYLFSSNFSNSDKITKSFLNVIHNFEKNGVKINRRIFSETIMYLNILGGTYILDYFETDELKEKITRKIDTLLYNDY